MDPTLRREIQELFDMSYQPMTPAPSHATTFASSSATPAVNNFNRDIGLFHGSVEAGPQMSTPSMSTSPPMSPSNIWVDNGLVHFDHSMHSNYVPLQHEPHFYPSINPAPFLTYSPYPHAAVIGGMSGPLGSTGMPSQFHNDGQALEFTSAASQDPASSSGYVLLNPSAMAAPSPPSIPERPAYHSDYMPPSPSSPVLSKLEQYYCFIDLEGIKQYQCLVCGKCIRNRLYNFQDHFKTHDPDRERFDCNWPGCNKPFTRKRDQMRHIEEDHLGIRSKRPTKTAKKPRKAASTGKRKGGQRKKD